MMRWMMVLAAGLIAGAAGASTFSPKQMVCPIGGEKFTYQALASISTYGGLPDGQPIGSGVFPVAMPQCPGNGFVLYRDFDAAQIARLMPFIAAPAYVEARKVETPYYLAYLLARKLGDREQLPWLLLSATWQAKRPQALGGLALRYDEEFVALVAALPVDAISFTSIALRARAANALRELGRFDQAEAARAAIVIAPDAGKGDNAAENRAGWATYLQQLAAPIARRDAARAPIDMVGNREAASRCLQPETKDAASFPPLTAFEADYCKRPDLAPLIARQRKWLAG